MTTTATIAPEFFIATCTAGHVARYTATERDAAMVLDYVGKFGCTTCPTCSMAASFKPIKVTITETECGPKCMTARGPRCDCSCGGYNHSKGYAA